MTDHVYDKNAVALHDQKNKTSPVAQVASWEESLIKGEKYSTGNLTDLIQLVRWLFILCSNWKLVCKMIVSFYAAIAAMQQDQVQTNF